MRVVRLALSSLLPAACLVACGPDNPSADTCSVPATDGVRSISFLSTAGDGASVPDHQAHALIIGPQGGSMVELRFGLQGDAVPSCANFVLSAERCVNLSCTEVENVESFDTTRALQTYEDGARRSSKNYLLQIPFGFGSGSLIRIQAEVGVIENSLLLWLDQEGPLLDAGPRDAGAIDADFGDAQTGL